MKLLLDLNVILDVLIDREPFAVDSAYVLERIENKKEEGIASALTFPILYYLLTNSHSSARARHLL